MFSTQLQYNLNYIPEFRPPRQSGKSGTMTSASFLPPGVFAIPPQSSTALLQGCRAVREESRTWLSWRHEKFISWTLLVPSLYLVFPFVSGQFPPVFPPLFPSPPNLSLLSLHSWQMTYQLTAFGISFLVLSFKDSEVHAS